MAAFRTCRQLVCLATVFAPLLLAPEALGQNANPADLRLVVHTNGPQQRIKSVRFSSDSRRLYAAGFDKRVYVWNLVDDDARRGGIKNAIPTTPIFWENGRDRRGLIESFEFSPTEDRVAVAGSSARGAYGDVVIFKETVRRFRESEPFRPGQNAKKWETSFLPQVRAAVPDPSKEHVRSVLDVAWSPSGRRLASSDFAGDVHVWNLQPQTSVAWGRGDGNTSATLPRPVEFLDEDRVLFTRLAANPDRKTHRGEVMLLDVSGRSPQARPLEPVHYGPAVFDLAVSRVSGLWASAAGAVYIWRDEEVIGTGRLPAGQMCTALSFGRLSGHRLLVATLDGRTGQTHLRLWNVSNPQRPAELDAVELVNRARPIGSVALSPDESRVAAINNQTNSVDLFEINENGRFRRLANGNPVRYPLSGTAGSISQVQFSDDDDLLLRWKLGGQRVAEQRSDRHFDLRNQRLIQQAKDVEDVEWRDSQRHPEWSLTTNQQRVHLQLKFRNRAQGFITLNPTFQGRYSTHAWILNDNRPVAVAVGTLTNGVFVYSLPDRDVRSRPLRYFRDHSDRINSLSVSRDGSLLASGSDDDTIKLWSLTDISKPHETFPESTIWGCAFQIIDGQLTATGVLDDGIAAARGLQSGDTVTRFGRYVNGELQELQNPQRMLEAIAATRDQIWDQVDLHISRDGDPVDREPRLVPGWEPVATLLVDQQSEWALWSARGYYASSAHGDKLFGWLENGRARGVTPRFYKAKELREDREDEKLLRELIIPRQRPNPNDPDQRPVKPKLPPPPPPPPPKLPQIRIIEPRNWQQVPWEQVNVVAEIDYTGTDPNAFVVQAFVSGARPEEVRQERVGNAVRYHWRIDPFQRDNHVSVKAHRRTSRIGHANHTEDISSFVARREPPPPQVIPQKVTPPRPARPAKVDPPEPEDQKPKVYFVGLGNNAADLRVLDSRLELHFPEKDVGDIHRTIATGASRGGHYEFSKSKYSLGNPLTGTKLTPGNFNAYANEVRDALKGSQAQDLVILSVCGHGFNIDDMYYFCGYNPQAAVNAKTEYEQVYGNELPKLLSKLTDGIDDPALQRSATGRAKRQAGDAAQKAMERSIADAAGIAWPQLEDMIANVPGRKLVILDTCHSGQAVALFEAGTGGSLQIGARVSEPQRKAQERYADAQDWLVVGSAQADKSAWELLPDAAAEAGIENSVFAHFLLEGLSGKADNCMDLAWSPPPWQDPNEDVIRANRRQVIGPDWKNEDDGTITVLEFVAYSFIQVHTQSRDLIREEQQTPRISNTTLPSFFEIPLVTYSGSD